MDAWLPQNILPWTYIASNNLRSIAKTINVHTDLQGFHIVLVKGDNDPEISCAEKCGKKLMYIFKFLKSDIVQDKDYIMHTFNLIH